MGVVFCKERDYENEGKEVAADKRTLTSTGMPRGLRRVMRHQNVKYSRNNYNYNTNTKQKKGEEP